ncbi:hypothetical protein [Sorangium sp. So ce1024]|uniref:hypothetical protein n=1 Tax=Sorangium sp. So ce1024 TaxID=3133327 RepID=UPI003F059576
MVDLAGVAPLSALTPILAACAVSAWALARGWRGRPRWPFYRPVALLLSWALATALSRGAIQHWILNPARAAIGEEAPYSGGARAWYLVELAVRLSWPFAILAATLAVFRRRRPWWLVGAWAVTAAALCWSYPEVRRELQWHIEAGVASACWTGSAWAVWRWYAGDESAPVAAHTTMMLVLAAQLSVIAVTLWSGAPAEHWTSARVTHGVMYAAVLAYQARKLWGRTDGS